MRLDPLVEYVNLNLNAYAIAQQISEEFLIDPENITIWADRTGIISQHMMAALKVYLLEEMVMEDRAEWPADWWQAFKERWFPMWLKKRYPICYAAKKWDCRFIYPSLPAKPNYKVAKMKEFKFSRPDEEECWYNFESEPE